MFNSNSGDHIVFDATLLNNGSDTLYLHFPIIVDNGLRIKGLIRGGDTLFISGHDSTQIFYMDFTNVPGQEVYLDSLAVIDAKKYAQDGSVTNQNGGAIFVSNLDSLIISNSVFTRCRTTGSGNGGAIFSTNTSLTVLNSLFVLNSTGTTTIGNLAIRGGAIEVRNGLLTLNNCVFKNNHSFNRGGAVYLNTSDFVVDNSVFVENEVGPGTGGSSMGGAICAYGEFEGLIEKTEFTFNKASSEGGALRFISFSVYSTNVRISNSMFRGNVSAGVGSALLNTEVSCSIIRSSIIENKSTPSGGETIYGIGGVLELDQTTISKNETTQNVGVLNIRNGELYIRNSTISDNLGGGSVDAIYLGSNPMDSVSILSSIITHNGASTFSPDPSVTSLGNNIFSDSPSFAIASDQTNVDSTMLALEPLAMNGGVTPTMLPGRTSVALNMGNPVDFADAQNGPIYGRRDVGAAERPVITFDTTSACSPVNWWGSTYTSAGTYSDTAYNANSIDSVGVLVLELQDTSVFELDGTLYAGEQDTNTTYQWVDCAKNYSPVSGATNQGFLPPANGSYAVILTNQNCVDTSSCISYNRFSISERSSTQDWLTFYPNPSSGTIHYSFTGHAPVQLEVLDLSGRNVVTFELDGESTFTLPSLAKGTYLLRWTGSQGEVQVDRVCIVD